MKLQRHLTDRFLFGLFLTTSFLALPLICSAQEKVAFVSTRDGNSEIYVMNADGTNQTRLTNNPADDQNPSMSPDSTKIAFTSNRDGAYYQIYLMNADGTNLTRLTNHPAMDLSPSFGSDGSKIVFSSRLDGNSDLYVMNADGTNQIRLTDHPSGDETPVFSPDGSKIVFTSSRDVFDEIYVMNADGTDQTNLTNHPAHDNSPSFSPDGSEIAFTSIRDGNLEIYVMNTDGTNLTRLTNNPAVDASPSFSPGVSKIAFVSTRAGNHEIFAMDADGSNPTNLTNNPEFDSQPSWGRQTAPVNGTSPALTSVTINDSPGDQNDPHVSGDWAAYSSGLTIRYYNFATHTDAQIPMGASARDLLSDISGSKIVFSRIIPGDRTAVMVFDAATPAVAPIEIDAAPGTSRVGSAIGGNTVAYIDLGLGPSVYSELVLHDLTTSTSVRITVDYSPDENPQVSPDGKHVTWERCNPTFSNCDIGRVTRDEVWSLWVYGDVSVTPNPEANPDTNGTLVVYDSFRAGNADVFWRPVSSGAEVQLQLAGFEGNPAIAGNFISIESRSTLGGINDLFVYDIVNNLLYQITDTPLVNEQLNDLTILPNCDLRAVWASDEDGANSRNIKAATFSLGGCSVDTTAPVLQDPIANVIVTLPLNSTATSTTVTFPTPTATDDSGTVTVTMSPVSGAVFPVGTTTVEVTAIDGAGNTDTGSFTVTVLHNFSGFLQPVDPMPTLNVVNAGGAVPVKFSLSGNKGLNIFAAGHPSSSQIACDANEPGDLIEETVSAGGSSLSYDAAADVYSYVWKTNKAWKGTCRILALRLTDGGTHFAKFRFK
jgi:Tol biopolymer transport system component